MKSILNLRKIVFVGVLIFFLVVASNILRNITSLWQRQYVIDQAKNERARVKEENSSLKSQLEYVSKPGFVEEEARNKLFYVKPGEQIVLIEKQEKASEEVEIVRLSPWKEWIALFFNF